MMKKTFLVISTIFWMCSPALAQQGTNEAQVEQIVWKMVDEGHFRNQNVAHLEKKLARIKVEISQAVKIANHQETDALLELESEKTETLYRIQLAGLIAKINPSLTGQMRADTFTKIADKIVAIGDNDMAKLSFLGQANPKTAGLFDEATLHSCVLAYKEIHPHQKLKENEAENYCHDKGIVASATASEGSIQSTPPKPVVAIGDALVQTGPPDKVSIEDYSTGSAITPK